MAGSLTQAQVEHFRREGYAFPFDAIPAAEAASYVAKLDSYDAILGEEAQKQLKIKAHVAAPWIVGLARNKNILDAVESLIGPDILLFGTSMFSKKARDARFVSWHQDAAYYGLDPQQEVTCWVGLTDADTENGCMRVIPGSHLGADAVHDETYDPQNMLGRGQTIRYRRRQGRLHAGQGRPVLDASRAHDPRLDAQSVRPPPCRHTVLLHAGPCALDHRPAHRDSRARHRQIRALGS